MTKENTLLDEVGEDAEDTRGRRMDPELLALSRLVRMLEELNPRAAARVMNYLEDRYRKEERL